MLRCFYNEALLRALLRALAGREAFLDLEIKEFARRYILEMSSAMVDYFEWRLGFPPYTLSQMLFDFPEDIVQETVHMFLATSGIA